MSRTYFIVLFACLLIAIFFNFGCGKYIKQYSSPVIISRYPVAGAASVASDEVLWVKFSKRMSENDYIGSEEVAQRISAATDSNATLETFPSLTVEAKWSDDNTKLTVYNRFYTGSTSNCVVHLVSAKNAFSDENGLFLPEHTTLWSYTVTVEAP